MAGIRIIDITINSGPSYVKEGPRCYCGHRDWIIKSSMAVCTNCNRQKKGEFTGYVVDGPRCYCGYSDWFASNDQWICTNCGREK